ncbi:MAG TPA: mobile mystery protein A [Chlorobaculum sp.]|jgi:predicted DNA-binding mobile mystery protein A|nr:mobile mystery protein A [Chlorobaculum sp.]
MQNKALQIKHLNEKMQTLEPFRHLAVPPTGWVKAVRTALGMSMQQLGNRLSITRQSVQDIEKREKEGSITIKALREVGRALDMDVVYVFLPRDGSLEALIERRATELATEIVMRTSTHMNLEGQGNSEQRLAEAIRERAYTIRKEMPKILWD